MRYEVWVKVVGYKLLGSFEASSMDEAKEMAHVKLESEEVDLSCDDYDIDSMTVEEEE